MPVDPRSPFSASRVDAPARRRVDRLDGRDESRRDASSWRGRGLAVLLLSAAVAGCAINPGATPIGAGSYQVSRQAFFPFGGTDGLRESALTQAGQHCAGTGGKPLILRVDETRPPYLLDHFPRAVVQFRCVPPA